MSGPGGTLTLVGDQGFTFTGGVSVTGGIFGPHLTCRPCAPGDPISLQALWVDNDLHGTATFQGVTYEQVGSLAPGRASGRVDFSGSAIAPPFDNLTTATVGAPFLFEGRFSFPFDGGASLTVASLVGSGAASVVLIRPPDGATWSYQSASYQFEEVDPIPEPGTLLLVGTALAGLALRRRRPTR